jgi:transmembrane sensor
MTDDVRSNDETVPNESFSEELKWRLISRCVSGEADDEEVARLEHAVGRDALLRESVEGLRVLWEHARTPTEPVDVDAVLRRIKELRIASATGPRAIHLTGFDELEPTTRWRRAGRYAHWSVTVLGAVAAAVLLWVGPKERPPHPAVSPVTVSEVTAGRGERGHVRLPDGTEVTLAPMSTLRYASDYGGRQREVSLDGEAVFTVKHDAAHPFVAHTAHATTTDLGTTFDIKAYRSDRSALVVVASGLVSVVGGDPAVAPLSATSGGGAQASAHPSTVVLRARDAVRIGKDGSLRVSHGVSTATYFEWTEGRLVFQDTPLEEALQRLSRWYDADLRLASDARDEFSKHPLTASLAHESLSNVVVLLTATLKMTADSGLVNGRRVVTLHRLSPEP